MLLEKFNLEVYILFDMGFGGKIEPFWRGPETIEGAKRAEGLGPDFRHEDGAGVSSAGPQEEQGILFGSYGDPGKVLLGEIAPKLSGMLSPDNSSGQE